MRVLTSPSEEITQAMICNYLRMRYPEAIFNSDGAGNNVSRTRAAKNTVLRSSAGYPDLFIAEPKGKFHGLYLEIKREGTKLCLNEGCILASHQHIHRQEVMLERLQHKGYAADFAVGYDEAISKIEWYMAL